MTAVTGAQLAGESTVLVPHPGSRSRTRGYASGKADYLAGLRKIEGRVLGLQKMVGDDRWCPGAVTQIASVTRAPQGGAVGLLSDHVRHCVLAEARAEGAPPQAGLDEVMATIRQIVRL